MRSYQVKDLMVPLSEYATVPQSATLLDAVDSLRKAQAAFGSRIVTGIGRFWCSTTGQSFCGQVEPA